MKLNTLVEEYFCSDKGKITSVFANFKATPLTGEWLNTQLVPYTEDELNEPWYSIDCQKKTIFTCHSRLIAL